MSGNSWPPKLNKTHQGNHDCRPCVDGVIGRKLGDSSCAMHEDAATYLFSCTQLGSPHCQTLCPLHRFLCSTRKGLFACEDTRGFTSSSCRVLHVSTTLWPWVPACSASLIRQSDASHHVARAVVVLDSSISSFVHVYVLCVSCKKTGLSSKMEQVCAFGTNDHLMAFVCRCDDATATIVSCVSSRRTGDFHNNDRVSYGDRW